LESSPEQGNSLITAIKRAEGLREILQDSTMDSNVLFETFCVASACNRDHHENYSGTLEPRGRHYQPCFQLDRFVEDGKIKLVIICHNDMQEAHVNLASTRCIPNSDIPTILSHSQELQVRIFKSTTPRSTPVSPPCEEFPIGLSLVDFAVVLDCSTLIALISEMSHTTDLSKSDLANPHLQRQWLQEQKAPLLHVLIPLLKNRALYTTQKIKSAFLNIVRTLAGPRERSRAQCLFPEENGFSSMEVASENSSILRELSIISLLDETETMKVCRLDGAKGCSDLSKRTTPNKKSNPLDDIVHSQGMQFIIVTSNIHYVRSIRRQGLNRPAWIHTPRSLIEGKLSIEAGIGKSTILP
jgi:hypothetical protein